MVHFREWLLEAVTVYVLVPRNLSWCVPSPLGRERGVPGSAVIRAWLLSGTAVTASDKEG